MANTLGLQIAFAIALLLVVLPAKVSAFGAGNIASVSVIEGKNWRHGDIEDVIKDIAFVQGMKWTSLMISRVYFGNWLRDYSQGIDVGTLTRVQADTVRLLIMILGTLTFGYSTREFEVTADRLGTYRPEEHIDNPKGYADGEDARKYDTRLRPAVRDVELEIDPRTGMKNYIANEDGDWATSTKFAKYSFERSIWFGRKWVRNGGKSGGKEEDLCEALRCLGQGLHTLEDFSAHSNYVELALREMGYLNVFPYTGVKSAITLRGKKVFPLVTGSFGGVDFFHSVIGEANDHFAQSQTEEVEIEPSELQGLDNALGNAQQTTSSHPVLGLLTSLLGKMPGGQSRELIDEANELQRSADAQMLENVEDEMRGSEPMARTPDESDYYAYAPGGSAYGSSVSYRDGLTEYDAPLELHHDPNGPPEYGIPLAGHTSNNTAGPDAVKPNSNFDPQKTIDKIKPILKFRDKINRKINDIVEKIPGLETIKEKISDDVQILVFSFLAPFVKPVIKLATKGLKDGSSELLKKSEEQQYEPWKDPYCTDPTHSLLSKDHFSNVLNEPAGQVAAEVLKYVVPKIFLAWEREEQDVKEITEDCVHIMHHPSLRDPHSEVHKAMFDVVEDWAKSKPRGYINDILSAESVRASKNHVIHGPNGHGSGAGTADHEQQAAAAAAGGSAGIFGLLGHLAGAQGHGSQGSSSPSAHGASSGSGGGSGNLFSTLGHLASSHGQQSGGQAQSQSSTGAGLLGALGAISGLQGQGGGSSGGNGGGSGGSANLLSTLGQLAGSSHGQSSSHGGGDGGQAQLLGKLASLALNHQTGGGGGGGGGGGAGGMLQNLQTLQQLSGLVGKREMPGEEEVEEYEGRKTPGPDAYYAAYSQKEYSVPPVPAANDPYSSHESSSRPAAGGEAAGYYQQQSTHTTYEPQAQGYDSASGNSTEFDYSAYGTGQGTGRGTRHGNTSYDYNSYGGL